jgi:RNA recognition motif-containing protein
MKRIFAGNLAPEATERGLTELFSGFGKVRSIRLVTDTFSGKCKGFGFLEMEGHEARAAIAALNGKDFLGRPLKVNEERPDNKRDARRR